jgi:hypothetical protein
MLLSFSCKRCYIGELGIQFLNNIRQSYSGELTYQYPNPMLTLAAGANRHADFDFEHAPTLLISISLSATPWRVILQRNQRLP